MGSSMQVQASASSCPKSDLHENSFLLSQEILLPETPQFLLEETAGTQT